MAKITLSHHHLSPPSPAFQPPPNLHLTYLFNSHLNFTPFKPIKLPHQYNHRSITPIIPKSTQESENNIDSKTEEEDEVVDTASELGEQIKKAMKEREEKVSKDFWSGVGEEIREIEWPPFNKVLGTTGVVLAVIAGSSVVLLTVNAVLAQLSDTVFAGKGVQDFFT